jgi:hypothetical protein
MLVKPHHDSGNGETAMVLEFQLLVRKFTGGAARARHLLRLSTSRTRLALILGLLPLALGAASCTAGASAPVAPTPISAPPARGVPVATALENLDFVTRLAVAAYPTSRLVKIAGHTDLQGRLLDNPIDRWSYNFLDADGRYYIWEIYNDGHVRDRGLQGEFRTGTLTSSQDIAPLLRLDSDRVIEIGLEDGGAAFIERFPSASIQVVVALEFGGAAVWSIEFDDAPCPMTMRMHASSGEVLSTAGGPYCQAAQ